MDDDAGHIGHVTKNLCFLFPRRLHIKFGFDWPSSLREQANSEYLCPLL